MVLNIKKAHANNEIENRNSAVGISYLQNDGFFVALWYVLRPEHHFLKILNSS